MRPENTYYLFTFLYRFGLGATMTLYVPWLHEIGLTYWQISLLNAIFWTSVILLELPTGMLADGRGRGWSIMTGASVYGVGALLYAQVLSFPQAIVCEVILALGHAFLSGATTAWVNDAPGRTVPIQKILANATMFTGIATILGTLLGVQVAAFGGRGLYWYLLAGFSLAAAAVAVGFMRGREPEHPMKEFEALRHAVAHLRRSPALRWAVAASMCAGIFGTFNMYWALLLLTKFTQTQLGFVWMLMYGAMVLSGWFVRTSHGLGLSGVKGIVLMIALGGVPMILFGIAPWSVAWLIFLTVHEFARGAHSPFAEAYVQEQIASGYRATYGSLQSFLGSIGMVMALLCASAFMSFHEPNADSIYTLWLISGSLAMIFGAGLWIMRPQVAQE